MVDVVAPFFLSLVRSNFFSPSVPPSSSCIVPNAPLQRALFTNFMLTQASRKLSHKLCKNKNKQVLPGSESRRCCRSSPEWRWRWRRKPFFLRCGSERQAAKARARRRWRGGRQRRQSQAKTEKRQTVRLKSTGASSWLSVEASESLVRAKGGRGRMCHTFLRLGARSLQRTREKKHFFLQLSDLGGFLVFLFLLLFSFSQPRHRKSNKTITATRVMAATSR